MDVTSYALSKQYTDKKHQEVSSELSNLATDKADRLKVASIEKDLKDYQQTLSQINVNQEAKQTVTGYGVVSLPKNAANGQVSAIGVKGMTLTNEVFVDTTKPYTPSGNGARLKFNFTGGIIFGTDYSPDVQSITVTASDKIFIYARVNQNTLYGTVSLQYVDNTRQTSTIPQTLNDKNEVYGTLIADKSSKANIYIVDNNVQNTTVTVPISFIVINQTRLGIANLTETQMVEMARKGYFTGTKSTISASRLKSVGKNLFGGKVNEKNDSIAKVFKISDKKFSVSGLHSSAANHIVYLGKFKNNTVYTFSGKHIQDSANKNSRLVIRYTDGTTKNFPTPSLTETAFSVSSDVGKTIQYLSITFAVAGGTTIYDNFQIEEGAVATSYEDYIELTQYVVARDINGNIVELRSLPNGVRDEVVIG